MGPLTKTVCALIFVLFLVPAAQHPASADEMTPPAAGNVGKSGKIYFGTKQGYPSKTEKREDYPGGYPMVYDPQTGKTQVFPIPVPHEGINSIFDGAKPSHQKP